MSLGPSDPTWAALAEELAVLAEAAGATQAVVMDAFNDLWCRAHPMAPERIEEQFLFLIEALATSERRLNAGGRVDHDGERFHARSFAAVYVLVLTFDGPWQGPWVHAEVSRSLPRIEALTTRLPPVDPGPQRVARAKRGA